MYGIQESLKLESAPDANQLILIRKERNAKKAREWRAKNKDRCRLHSRTAYQKNKEKRKVSDRKYYESNKERIIKKQKEYYKNNPEHFKLYQKDLRKRRPSKHLYEHARRRAREKGIEFKISEKDIVVPSFCPLLEIPIFNGTNTMCDNSPSVDRIDLNLGYIPENIMVISYKANRMKSNSTFEEFETMYKNWSKGRNKWET